MLIFCHSSLNIVYKPKKPDYTFIKTEKGGKKLKDLRTETGKLLSTFITLTVITVSTMLIAMGVFAAKNNTAMIDDGITPAMIYARRENTQISVQIGEALYENKPQKEIPLTRIAELAPAPINGIYIIYENVCEIIKK